MSSRERSRALVAVGVVGLIGVGIVVGARIGRGTKGSLQKTVWGEPRSRIEFEPKPGQSPEFVSAMVHIRNELPYKASWDDQDVDFVVHEMDIDVADVTAHVDAGDAAPNLGSALAAGMTERDIRKTFSILITAEILGANEPMSTEGRRRLEAMLTALLEHPDPYYRRLGIDAMFDSGLIKQDPVYQWVNEIAANDQDKFTRERASYLLNDYDLAVLSANRAKNDEGS
jgi:hypothetical protein